MSHAAIRLSWTPGVVSWISWRIGSRCVVVSTSPTRGDKWQVEARVWDMLRWWDQERSAIFGGDEEEEVEQKAKKSITCVPWVLITVRVWEGRRGGRRRIGRG